MQKGRCEYEWELWCIVMRMRKGGNETRVLLARLVLECPLLWTEEGRGWVARGHRRMARRHDLWPAGCVCAGAHEQPVNNWQSVGQRVGFTTSVVHACQLVAWQLDNDGVHLVSTEIGQSGTNWPHREWKLQDGETWWKWWISMEKRIDADDFNE